MPRFIPYLGVVFALALSAFFAAIFNDIFVLQPSLSAQAVTPETLSIPLDFTASVTGSSGVLAEDTAATKISTASSKSKAASEKIVSSAESAQEIAPQPRKNPATTTAQLSPEESAALNLSASALRNALVNIVCYVPPRSGLHSISGSGIFVDPKGIILTNAHIAQYFLLADRGVSCSVRSGSPATEKYTADLLYISPSWVRANAKVLTEINPSGTGEYDFALLAVSGSISSSIPLPSSFPFVPLASTSPSVGTPVSIASYGAQFLESAQVQSFLFPTIVFGSIKDIFTFAVYSVDIFTLGGSAAAQEGSSGGGVANSKGELIGTITTSTIKGDTSTRSLNAITATYIRTEYTNETDRSLDSLFAKPVSAAVSDFTAQAQELSSILSKNLP